jgi:starvation-inducible outer membrane lipoprotein
MRVLACAIAVALTACNSLPADPAKMSPEQLREWAKDKSASVTCVSAKNAVGNVTTVVANLDKGVSTTGTLTISTDCVTTISAAPPK